VSASTSPPPPDACGSQPVDRLTAAVLAYLLLPNLIFLGGWLRWLWAAPAIALLLWAASRSADWRQALRAATPVSAKTMLFLVAAGFAWAMFGGAGHFFYANSDWPTRDAVLGDLAKNPWPLAYPLANGGTVMLRTAMGYFLPAATFAKVFGLATANGALYVWTALGTVLFLLLLPWRAGKGLPLQLGVIVLFSGMDFVGTHLGRLSLNPFMHPFHIEWWAGQFQYSSLTTQLFWVPNHALPGWLAAALYFRHRQTPDLPRLLAFALPLLILWSPFAVLGMLPFVLLEALQRLSHRRPLTVPFAVIAGCLPLTYITLRLMTLKLEAIQPAAHFTTRIATGNERALFEHAVLMFEFVMLEAGLLVMILTALRPDIRTLLGMIGAVLALLPFVTFGPSNDIVMRASIPALVLLAIVAAQTVPGAALPGTALRQRLVLGTFLLVGAITPLYEFWRAIALRPWPADYSKSLAQVQSGGLPPHYVGRNNRRDLTFLLREPQPQTPAQQ
jgi:hypothetical protein